MACQHLMALSLAWVVTEGPCRLRSRESSLSLSWREEMDTNHKHIPLKKAQSLLSASAMREGSKLARMKHYVKTLGSGKK